MEVEAMTKAQRILAVALAGALLLSGFAFGRLTHSSGATAAGGDETKLAASSPQPSPSPEGETQSFYLSDYKTGYSNGYDSGLTGQSSGIANTARPGYNEGFKEGFADGYQARTKQSAAYSVAGNNLVAQPVAYRGPRQRVVYRTVTRPVYYTRRSRGSKLRTALRIAAPAAIGAGIGAIAGGKKGAGAGALIGGGAGAIYHLIKSRRD
jgi:hypothetical protein